MNAKRKKTVVLVTCVLLLYVLAYAFMIRRAYSLNKQIDALSLTGGIRYLDISTEEAGCRNERALIVLHLFFLPANFVHTRLLGGPQHNPNLPMYRFDLDSRSNPNAQPQIAPYPKNVSRRATERVSFTSGVRVSICAMTNQVTVTSNWYYVAGRVHPPTTNAADLVVVVQNGSNQAIDLFEEWNSWGYCNLKFVFWGGDHEFWVTKAPGYWYRNFPSRVTLAPGASLQIPVAFTTSSWTGLDAVATNCHWISEVRGVYEQHRSLETQPMSVAAWEGIVSSVYYPAATLLPRFHFAAVLKKEETRLSEDDIEVEIK